MELYLEHHSLAGQVLCMVALREGDVDVEFVACLVAQDAVLKAGDHAAAAQLHGLVLCGAALEGHAVQQALKGVAVSASFASDRLPIEQPPKSYSIRSG